MSDFRKTRNRKRLAQRIKIRGIKIFFCDYCSFHSFVCRIFPEFKYCGNCVRFNRADYNAIEINLIAFIKMNKKRYYNAPLSVAYPDMKTTNKHGEFYIA